jgi:hypothetical protein
MALQTAAKTCFTGLITYISNTPLFPFILLTGLIHLESVDHAEATKKGENCYED